MFLKITCSTEICPAFMEGKMSQATLRKNFPTYFHFKSNFLTWTTKCV
jgi:hypothetical protein